MKYRVVIVDEALADIRKHLDYIADDCGAPLAALRWWEKSVAAIDSLETMPRRCPRAPEDHCSELELRMLIVDRCLFIFHVDDAVKTVEVLKFRHGSRDTEHSDG